ncbi:integrase/recombinase XerC [Methylovorus glucosotrophus]|jgi:integrase/recombinase XerC|uniref:tyrosine recombinase XerC n=1 Tax=Methylovorus glucosotrophus TaxID=266009 RepID=UPI001331A7B3|nr:tyrosine recombinase XerC [Methylovorus glucosotrophus]KAF0836038.1 integrase/recombinase XerC [Methylovorus glucosotrophus]
MVDYLVQYLDHLSHERRLSPLTRENYQRDLKVLLELNGEVPLQNMTGTHIRRHVATLHGRNLGGRSIARMLSAWRGFFEFLIQRHGFSANPCQGIRAPKSPKSLPHALSPDQAVQLVSIDDEDTLAQRDHAMLELFYSSGLRLAELVNLNLDALNLGEGTITVTGKGNKTRIVPVGQHAMNALQAWLAIRSGLPIQDTSALFLSRLGKRLSRRAVQYRLQQWAIRQGINIRVHPHMLRHSFASHVLQSSGDLRAVQEMLGHANISTTQVYTHLDFHHLAKVYDSAHPRARKK